jgi:hypothetical protein
MKNVSLIAFGLVTLAGCSFSKDPSSSTVSSNTLELAIGHGEHGARVEQSEALRKRVAAKIDTLALPVALCRLTCGSNSTCLEWCECL